MATVRRVLTHSCPDCGTSTHKINEDAIRALSNSVPEPLRGDTANRVIGQHLAKIEHDTSASHTIKSTHKSMMSGRSQSFTHGKDHN